MERSIPIKTDLGIINKRDGSDFDIIEESAWLCSLSDTGGYHKMVCRLL